MKNAIWLLGRKEMVMWLLGRRKQNVNVVSGKKTKCQCGFRKEDKKMSIWFQERKQNVNTHNNTMSMWFQERRQNVNVVSGKKTKCQCGFRKENKMSIHTTTQCPCGFRKEDKMSMWFQERKQNVNVVSGRRQNGYMITKIFKDPKCRLLAALVISELFNYKTLIIFPYRIQNASFLFNLEK